MDYGAHWGPSSGASGAYKGFKSNLQHRAVARALATWRRESGMSVREVSEAAKWSTAKTSMMQNAACPIFEADVIALALVYGINDARRIPVYLGAQRARDPRAFDRTGDPSKCIGWTVDEIQAEAQRVRMFATDTLPDAFRIPEYARSLGEAQANAVQDRAKSESAIPQGWLYSQLETGKSMLQLDLVIAEPLLRRPVGGATVMAAQLVRLMEWSELAGVTVQVVPDSLGASTAVGVQFSELRFREDRFDNVVHVENLHGGTWLEEGNDRQPYEQTFNKLTALALPADYSVELIANAASDFQELALVM